MKRWMYAAVRVLLAVCLSGCSGPTVFGRLADVQEMNDSTSPTASTARDRSGWRT